MVATSGGYQGKHYNCLAHRPANNYWEVFIKRSVWKTPFAFRHVLKIDLSFQSNFCGSAG